jgi:hypothetical protein
MRAGIGSLILWTPSRSGLLVAGDKRTLLIDGGILSEDTDKIIPVGSHDLVATTGLSIKGPGGFDPGKLFHVYVEKSDIFTIALPELNLHLFKDALVKEAAAKIPPEHICRFNEEVPIVTVVLCSIRNEQTYLSQVALWFSNGTWSADVMNSPLDQIVVGFAGEGATVEHAPKGGFQNLTAADAQKRTDNEAILQIAGLISQAHEYGRRHLGEPVVGPKFDIYLVNASGTKVIQAGINALDVISKG